MPSQRRIIRAKDDPSGPSVTVSSVHPQGELLSPIMVTVTTRHDHIHVGRQSPANAGLSRAQGVTATVSPATPPRQLRAPLLTDLDQRLVRPLPPRCQFADVWLPARLCLAAGDHLAATQAPRTELALAQTPLPTRLVADRRNGQPLQPGGSEGHPLPLPRQPDPHSLGPAGLRAAVV